MWPTKGVSLKARTLVRIGILISAQLLRPLTPTWQGANVGVNYILGVVVTRRNLSLSNYALTNIGFTGLEVQEQCEKLAHALKLY